MTNSLLIYEESGYLFNDMTKRLEWFEIDKILISFTYGVVRYIGTWGGGRTDKVLEVERLYSSEECFKKGDSIPKRKISIYDAFRSLYGFFPIDDYVWEYKNGRAVKGELEYFDVEIDNKGKIYCKETYYRTCEDVYKFNDFYNAWCTYPEGFSLEDLMRQCYDNFFKSWHEEYEYWADDEDAIREELHHNQYEDRLYYENGDVYVEPLNEIV